MKKNIRRGIGIEANLRELSLLTKEELFHRLTAAPEGLESGDASDRLRTFGKNAISAGEHNTVFKRLRTALVNPFNAILLVVAALTYFTDVISALRPDYLTVIIILALVLLSSLVAFVQGERSNRAAANLSKMISNKADVLRDGALIEMPMEDIVPGDIVRLSAGDMLPADVRFLTTKDTFVAQAALTGESNPVEKFDALPADGAAALTDLPNIGFMGADVISGSATAVVLLTGDDTYFGSMARSLSGNRAKTSFERGVDSVSRLLVRMMLLMLPIVFLINGLFKGDWSSALLFSISIAVGLTPEMLPMIMTSTLASGAVAMSRHQVIVRTLSAIQTLGEMDVLLTDKTGTLTEDRIVLEKYMDTHGADDMRVLRHAYLNSHFQTGLKNLIDIAIVNRAAQNGLEPLLSDYRTVDEIPFDFSRRRMSVVLEDKNGKRQLITKGAVEEVMAICAFVEVGGQVVPMDDAARAIAMETYAAHNAEGLRMLALAQRTEPETRSAFSVEDEREMVLIGFVGFLDPPKESAAAAIATLRDHGVRTAVLTGDSEGVAIKVCKKVGVKTDILLTGKDVEGMDDLALEEAARGCDLFAKLSPAQKERVVKAFQAIGHTVGYMGDGINDAPALRCADVGISVDSAVDIAKETADIVLLKKDLMVLEEGVVEGRRTFGNITKYIKMAASGNFGNMLSVIAASIFLPFLPLLPVQILAQNLLCDFSQIGIPFDSVDRAYLEKPHKWETKSIKSFMAFFGPLSSVFDILLFAILWRLGGHNAALFQGGWFVFGTVSQVLVIHMIRTARVPFLQSRPSAALTVSTFAIAVTAVIIGFSPMAIGLDMQMLGVRFAPGIALVLIGYLACVQLVKRLYIRRYGDWM